MMKKVLAVAMAISFMTGCGSGEPNNSTLPPITDTTPPEIVIQGDKSMSLIQHQTYEELGAVATDDIDGDINVTVSGTLDTTTPGTYTIIYSATDKSGNTGSDVRSITVLEDNQAPHITLIGAESLSLKHGEFYSELGVTVTDNSEVELTYDVSGTVDTTRFGIYSLTYTAIDLAGNQSSVTRNVVVEEYSAPIVIQVLSSSGEIDLGLVAHGDYRVDWGDGNTSINQDKHNYGVRTEAVISIYGRVGGFRTCHVDSWGEYALTSMKNMFKDCESAIVLPEDAPDLQLVADMSGAFSGGYFEGFNQPIEHWDVSNVKDMSNLFYRNYAFNQPIDNWDVSSVINMSSMFAFATSFNQPLGNWDVSSVTDMSDMFRCTVSIFKNGEGCAFDQPLNDWNVASVTNMSYMFAGSSLSHPLDDWNVSSVQDMSGMFAASNAFQHSLQMWNVSGVTNMSGMFSNHWGYNLPLDSWDISSVKDMSYMFAYTKVFNQPLNTWDVSNVENMAGMFMSSSYRGELDQWDVSNVTNMSEMFKAAGYRIPNVPSIGNWNVSSVTNMSEMFAGNNFNQPLNDWDVSGVKDMSKMFYSATLFNYSIKDWDVSSVKDMSGMFERAFSFNKPVNDWDVSNVSNMINMFKDAASFNQDIGDWQFSSIEQDVLYDAYSGERSTGLRDMMKTSAIYATEYYDRLLNAFARSANLNGVQITTKANFTVDGQASRNLLKTQYGWQIDDYGLTSK